MRSTVGVVLVLLCALGLVARAEVSVTTADGIGADTYLTNDSQENANTRHGTDNRIRAFRAFAGTRMKIGYMRFDLSGIAGDPNDAVLSFDATYLKGGAKSVDVYALKDGPGDYWDEASITYNNAPGFVPNPPTAEAQYAFVDGAVTDALGILGTPAIPEDPVTYPVRFTSDPVSLPLTDLLKNDLNGIVTLIFIGADNEAEVASKEHADFNPPTLTLPNCYPVNRASSPTPADYERITTTAYPELTWTLPEPNLPSGVVSCDLWFSDSEPNTLLPDDGMILLDTDNTTGAFTMPALTTYETYYWRVDTYDTSREPVFEKGKVWSFNTHNSAPTVNAGEDQYVWLTGGEIVDTTSSNDTYMRDNTDRGGMEFVDVRYVSSTSGFGGYMQFDLSDLAALPPNTVSNATLTLTKVAGSRNDGITNDRFSLQGLNNVAGNTPQNWDEHALNTDTVGDEWTFPLDLLGGRLTDLDDDVTGISEVVSGADAGSTITITGAALDAFLQSRIDDGGLVTFVITCEISGKGYGIASKENSNPAYRPRLQLNYGVASVDVTLSGDYGDDGLPAETETMLWTEVSRPEDADPVVISPDDVKVTSVNLTTPGFYEFQLAVDDTDLVGTDTVQIYVGTNPCDAAQNTPDYAAHIADFNSDCFVTLEDFVTFAAGWMDCTSLECP